jgi:hypothetical protein
VVRVDNRQSYNLATSAFNSLGFYTQVAMLLIRLGDNHHHSRCIYGGTKYEEHVLRGAAKTLTQSKAAMKEIEERMIGDCYAGV